MSPAEENLICHKFEAWRRGEMIFLKGRLRRMRSDFISLASVCSKSNKKICLLFVWVKSGRKKQLCRSGLSFHVSYFFLAACDRRYFQPISKAAVATNGLVMTLFVRNIICILLVLFVNSIRYMPFQSGALLLVQTRWERISDTLKWLSSDLEEF